MRLKRFYAANQRQAMNQIRDELGDDAVILSSQSTPHGVEVVAAVDPEQDLSKTPRSQSTYSNFSKSSVQGAAQADAEMSKIQQELAMMRSMMESQMSQMAWGQYSQTHPIVTRLLKKLMSLGLPSILSRDLVKNVDESQGFDAAWIQAQANLWERIPEHDYSIMEHGGVVAFVGPTGVGKTTTIAKLAARFAMRHGQGSVGIISTDGFRVGAIEQLRTFADLIGVPLSVAEDKLQLSEALMSMRGRKLILVDTAGMSQRDLRLNEQLTHDLDIEGIQIRNYLVVSAATQKSTLEQIMASFARLKLSGCILTKLDEATRLGQVLSAMIENQLPVAYVSEGQRVPEDLRLAHREDLIESMITLAGLNSEQSLDEEILAMSFAQELTNVK